jgi:hypothetical protein
MTLVVAVVLRRVCWVLIVRTIVVATLKIMIAEFIFHHLSSNNINISGRTGDTTIRRRTLVVLIELRSYVPRRGESGISIGGWRKTMVVVVTKEVNILCNNMQDEMEITTTDIAVTSMLLPLLTHRVRLRFLDSMTATITEAVRVLMVGNDGGVNSSSKIGINLHIPHHRQQQHRHRGKLRRLNP